MNSLGSNWSLFFMLTAVGVVPSLLILAWLAPRLIKRYPEAFTRGDTRAG